MYPPPITCPHCRNAVAVDPRFAGHVIMCPHCRGSFQMPITVVSLPPTPVPLIETHESSPPRAKYARRKHSGKKWLLLPAMLSAVLVVWFAWGFVGFGPVGALDSALTGWVAGRHPSVAPGVSFCDCDRSCFGHTLLEYKIESSHREGEQDGCLREAEVEDSRRAGSLGVETVFDREGR